MLLYIMLYVVLAYLMLLAALSNAVCLYNAFVCHWILEMLFVFMLCLGLLTQFVCFMCYFASCTVLLVCWFFLILWSHRFVCVFIKGLCALWRSST